MKNIYVFDLDDTIIMHKKYNPLQYDKIQYNHKIDQFLSRLDGPKYIYTNGTYGHADKVLSKMNISNHFNIIYARDTLDYMKPEKDSFLQVYDDILYQENINKKDSHNVYFYDDLLSNLNTAYHIGWNTIWIHSDYRNYKKYYFVDQSYRLLEDIN